MSLSFAPFVSLLFMSLSHMSQPVVLQSLLSLSVVSPSLMSQSLVFLPLMSLPHVPYTLSVLVPCVSTLLVPAPFVHILCARIHCISSFYVPVSLAFVSLYFVSFPVYVLVHPVPVLCVSSINVPVPSRVSFLPIYCIPYFYVHMSQLSMSICPCLTASCPCPFVSPSVISQSF